MPSYKPGNQPLWVQVIDSACFFLWHHSSILSSSLGVDMLPHLTSTCAGEVWFLPLRLYLRFQDCEKESFNPPWQQGAWHITGTKNSFLDEQIHPYSLNNTCPEQKLCALICPNLGFSTDQYSFLFLFSAWISPVQSTIRDSLNSLLIKIFSTTAPPKKKTPAVPGL